MKRSSPSRTSLKRRKPLKKRNAARRKTEFARAYHSVERVEFVKSLPCAACGVVGYSENAHIETEGMGRKASYLRVVPLCGRRGVYVGCHRFLHNMSRGHFEFHFNIDLDRIAADTESAWKRYEASNV